MTEFKKTISLAWIVCTAALVTAAPVSREYVDQQIEKVDEKISQIEDKIANSSQSYLYDTAIPSTNALDSFGMLYKMSTEHSRGGIWQVNQVTEQGAITHYAPLAAESKDDFTWTSSNGVFAVDYSMTTGLIRVALDIGSDTNIGWYASTTNTSPIKNELKKWSYQSGYDFASLAYVPQGENVMSNTPYDSFVRLTKHQSDLNGVVRSVNGQSGPVVTLQIPSIAGLASETYVNDKIVQSLYVQDPYKRTYLDQSIVGRLWYLEKTAQEYAHNVVYDLWSEDFSRVITGKGDVYSTTNRPYGIWTRTTISDPDTILEWFTEVSEGNSQFSWRSPQSNVLVYCPTNGLLTYNGSDFAVLEINLNPAAGSDLGSVTNATTQNIYKFTTRGWVKKDKVTTLVFDNQLASKAVTGLRIDNETYYDGTPLFRRGDVTLPNYTGMFKYLDMDTWSSGYADKSVVGRIKYLESGGANIEYLNRNDIATYYDDVAKTNKSIVANIMNIKNDYVTKQAATNIAGSVASNSVDMAFIQRRGFYNTNEVDTLIANVVEQKRIQYLYNDVDSPTQLVDSVGQLYLFGIEDLGGSFNVTVQENPVAVGEYKYDGLRRGTNYWKSASGFFIWYDPATGAMGDPSTTYEGSEEKKGLVPTNCAAIPPINNAPVTVASFTPQQSTEQRKYSDPFARFAFKSELDGAVDSTLYKATNMSPRIYAAQGPETNSFSQFFKVNGDLDARGAAIQQLGNGKSIDILLDTAHNDIIEIGFKANMPDIQNYVFMRPSTKSLPELGTTNWYLYAKNPDYRGSSFRASGDRTIKLEISKTTGQATMTVTNELGGAAQVFALPANAYRSCNDYLSLVYESPSSSTALFSIFMSTVYVRYSNGNKQYLVGSWAEDYSRVYKVYAEHELVEGDAVHLRQASAIRYGVVKPDGVTVRVEDGLLKADAGGASLDDVKAMLLSTNITEYGQAAEQSLVGAVLGTQTAVSNLNESVIQLSEQINGLNTRLEQILDGE